MDEVRRFPMREALGQLAPLIGLLAVWLLFALLEGAGVIESGYFLSLRNHRQILITTAVVGTAGIGATCVIIVGEIDLSVGSAIALGTVIMALLITAGVPPAFAVLLGIAAGAAIGFAVGSVVIGYLAFVAPVVLGVATAGVCWSKTTPLNAVLAGLVVLIPLVLVFRYTLKRLPMPSFIVTLALWGALRGTAELLAGNKTVNIDRATADVAWIERLLSHPEAAVPAGVWIFLSAAVLMMLVLRYTVFGRHLFAIGSNPETARLCGVKVDRCRLMVFALAGAFAALAALLQFSYLYATGDPTTAVGYELTVIAAVVIGGASLSGGSGSILGTIAGALIMTVVNNGCVKLGIPNSIQKIVTGGIIVAAVALDQMRHRKTE